MGTGEVNAEGNWTGISSRRGIEIHLVASCYRNRVKLRPNGPQFYNDNNKKLRKMATDILEFYNWIRHSVLRYKAR